MSGKRILSNQSSTHLTDFEYTVTVPKHQTRNRKTIKVSKSCQSVRKPLKNKGALYVITRDASPYFASLLEISGFSQSSIRERRSLAPLRRRAEDVAPYHWAPTSVCHLIRNSPPAARCTAGIQRISPPRTGRMIAQTALPRQSFDPSERNVVNSTSSLPRSLAYLSCLSSYSPFTEIYNRRLKI